MDMHPQPPTTAPEPATPPAPPAPLGYPVPGQPVSSVGKLIVAGFLDGLLALVTLFIGWVVWATFTAARGQTPAKQLMGMRVVDLATGRPLSWGYYVLMRGLLGGFVGGLASTLTFGVLWLMPLWDTHNQSVAAKVSNSVVVNT